ncbi:MAG TPA: hypothetical protein PL018_00110 [Ignavibacteriaceae bacterium]|nr:hypothetical protein [Ignavibacterium sp.]HRN24992.1 hypothetical protein [Ignavibacteriaceae bacterium]HRP94396.1 hypothetical protein [Ignavibacteriaceae bacterium]HRQ52628.1 hypothetical protein [Ignavibacteriaceae bacterium]
MKKNLLFLLIAALFLITACKESTTEPPVETMNDQYYKIQNGASLIYNLEIKDSTGFTVTGNRFTSFNDSTIIEGTTYYIQNDSFQTFLPFDTLTHSSSLYVRKSNTGVFSYADTTGFTGFIPDTLRQYLSVDKESRLLFYPLAVNQTFPVYTLTLSVLIVGINVIDIDAVVESQEIINTTINNLPEQFNTFKIKYSFVVRTSSTGPETLYEAYGWVVKELGFVKWDGDAEVFNFLLNENIFPPETNVKMDLISYQF